LLFLPSVFFFLLALEPSGEITWHEAKQPWTTGRRRRRKRNTQILLEWDQHVNWRDLAFITICCFFFEISLHFFWLMTHNSIRLEHT
jgi:hypothetical protein